MKDTLHLLTTGSVDDGKSTLIGRMLYESGLIYKDQMRDLQKDCGRHGAQMDLAWLLDGLKAEREQGITIDVAYRYFATSRRKFIISDTPGHEQYVRNMVTGGSTADLAVILVDARKGILTQTRRHTYLVSLLGIRQVVLAVNKMDLAGYSRETFDRIVCEFGSFAGPLGLQIYPIPISALEGENISSVSSRMPWYAGKSFLDYIETVDVVRNAGGCGLRLPVQLVLRKEGYRGYCGRIRSGSISKGDNVLLLPSGKGAEISGISIGGVHSDCAEAPLSVAVSLSQEMDLSRGEMIVSPAAPPAVGRRIRAMLVWMNDSPLERGTAFFLKHTTRTTRARVAGIGWKVNVNTLEHLPADTLSLNDIACVDIVCSGDLFYDAYCDCRETGSFILIDPVSNATSAFGMILGGSPDGAPDCHENGYVLDLSALGIGKEHEIAVSKVCEELARQGAVITVK